MSENPLLPNAQLRALHTLVQESLSLNKAASSKKKHAASRAASTAGQVPGREALLAATVLQLCAGDILVGEPGDRTASGLVRANSKTAEETASTLDLPSGAPQLALAAGLASALGRSGGDHLVFALLSPAHPHGAWAETLALAQAGKHPLVIACADASGPDTFRATTYPESQRTGTPWTWSSVQKVSKKLQMPVLSVDGEDAVAVYRVMQESVLRARSGGGPAILWAMLPTGPDLAAGRPKSASPLRRLERYCRERAISL